MSANPTLVPCLNETVDAVLIKNVLTNCTQIKVEIAVTTAFMSGLIMVSANSISHYVQ